MNTPTIQFPVETYNVDYRAGKGHIVITDERHSIIASFSGPDARENSELVAKLLNEHHEEEVKDNGEAK